MGLLEKKKKIFLFLWDSKDLLICYKTKAPKRKD